MKSPTVDATVTGETPAEYSHGSIGGDSGADIARVGTPRNSLAGLYVPFGKRILAQIPSYLDSRRGASLTR